MNDEIRRDSRQQCGHSRLGRIGEGNNNHHGRPSSLDRNFEHLIRSPGDERERVIIENETKLSRGLRQDKAKRLVDVVFCFQIHTRIIMQSFSRSNPPQRH
eukprot:GABV01007190.1.p1 GENE.GABV01007190.1~~GABV01007190.1.p1  ORF type:complete len:101 (-),score=15.29 GABV01007190.1:11-313(-)